MWWFEPVIEPEPLKARWIDRPTAQATGGGKALPTCRYAEVFLPQKIQSSGKPCSRATMRTVSFGYPSRGKSDPGGSSAIPRPSTPRERHARRARVGPRSGPPCFLDPPTIVGAMSWARKDHSFAPGQHLSDIWSASACPTVGGFCISEGHTKRFPILMDRKATNTNRGLSCGTPKSRAFSTRHSMNR